MKAASAYVGRPSKADPLDGRGADGLGRPSYRCLIEHRVARQLRRRAGQASLDYILVLGVVLPMAAFILKFAPRIIKLVYEMTCVLVSWPFM